MKHLTAVSRFKGRASLVRVVDPHSNQAMLKGLQGALHATASGNDLPEAWLAAASGLTIWPLTIMLSQENPMSHRTLRPGAIKEIRSTLNRGFFASHSFDVNCNEADGTLLQVKHNGNAAWSFEFLHPNSKVNTSGKWRTIESPSRTYSSQVAYDHETFDEAYCSIYSWAERMNEQTRRKNGATRYILLRGIFWGGLMLLGGYIIPIVFQGSPRTLESALFNVTLWAGAGALLGAYEWRRSEYIYRKRTERGDA